MTRKKAIIGGSILGIIVIITGIVLIVGTSALGSVFQFITNEIFGMNWLNELITLGFTSMFGAEFATTWYGSSAIFFVYDTIKIVFLLCSLIFLISYIQSYFPPERTKKILSKFNGIKGNIFGALLGTVTPFCSCSSIPLFMGFTKAGIRSGVTFSFLISSPLVDLAAFVLLGSIFNFKIALVYVVFGLILAVVGGFIIEKTGIGNEIEDIGLQSNFDEMEIENLTKKQRLIYSKEQMTTTFKKVIPYIVIGVGIGAFIHNVIPEAMIQSLLGEDNIFSVAIATAVGVPMYADIFGTIPVAEALFLKGAGVGTILAFMMSVTALSLPSMFMLRRVIKPKLLAVFITVVVVGILLIGYGFNWFSFLLV